MCEDKDSKCLHSVRSGLSCLLRSICTLSLVCTTCLYKDLQFCSKSASSTLALCVLITRKRTGSLHRLIIKQFKFSCVCIHLTQCFW